MHAYIVREHAMKQFLQGEAEPPNCFGSFDGKPQAYRYVLRQSRMAFRLGVFLFFEAMPRH